MENLYDVVIVGGGPSGLTAALYLARARYRVLVLEKEQFGGQIAITEDVVNYPGIEKISGKELTDTMKRQAEGFGAAFRREEAVRFSLSGDIKTVYTHQSEYRCFGLLLATGAHPRMVGFQGEEAFRGHGVAYCATCDGEFFTGKEVFVVGGGYAAAEEGVFLTKYARHVTILVRKSDFSCAASLAEKAKSHDKITVLTNTVLEAVSGDSGLTYARYKNTVTGQVTEYRAEPGEHFGVFVFAGYTPATEEFRDLVQCDERGYLLTDSAGKTNVDGVYAAGDVRVKPLRQVVTATADGALAATELEKYVVAMQEKTGLRPQYVPPKEISAQEEKEEAISLFTASMRQQLEAVFDKMEEKLLLKLYLDERPVSKELEAFMKELASLTEKLDVQVMEQREAFAPCVSICKADGKETGLAFHGVPGGHEFTSFVLGLYNAAGPGQPLEEGIMEQIRTISKPVDLKILVTLSCQLCPELVKAAQQIAAACVQVTAHVYDIRHFEQLRDRYHVMSVPCLIVDDEKVFFGKKDVGQILDLLKS